VAIMHLHLCRSNY